MLVAVVLMPYLGADLFVNAAILIAAVSATEIYFG
jgi:hypothetical protein